MSSHSINKSTCKECDLCFTICPSGILKKDERDITVFNPERTHICVKCGHCMAVCSKRSISIEGLSYEENLPPIPNNPVHYEEFKSFLMTRRSIRHFLDRPVPVELLQKIVDTIALAPFGVDAQKVEITVVANRKLIEKGLPEISQMYLQLGKMLKFAPMRWFIRRIMPLDESNTLLGFLLPHINLGLYDITKEDDISRNAPAMLLFHAAKGSQERKPDSMIYTTYAFLAAHSLGLGATVIGLIGPGINRSKKLKELYQIPAENEVLQTVILGYPKMGFKRAIVRPKKVTILE